LISAVILGAGHSTRFGKTKQLLKVGDATLLETVVGGFLNSRVDEVVLVLGYAADEIREKSDFGDAKIVVNTDYDRGLGTSLKAGIDAVSQETKAAIVALGDQPLLSVRTIDLMVDKFLETGGPIVAPFFQRHRGNPVLFDRSLFPDLRNVKGDTGAKALLGRLSEKVMKVQVDDMGVLFDVDNENDYARLLERLKGNSGNRPATK
jgi:molybdenum cofactor cytidylyltransferase